MMNRTLFHFLLTTVAVLTSNPTLPLATASYRIDAFTISGGGGASAGGGYILSGTVGEVAPEQMAGGGYELAGGFWGVAFEVILPEPDESFTEWMDSLPPEEQPPEDARGPYDAPAGDGMSNLLKYALGLKPMTPSRDGAPRPAPVTRSQNGETETFLSIEFTRSKSAMISLHMQSSANLNQWTDIPFVTEILEEIDKNRERVRLISDISVNDDHPQAFLRLRITKL